MNSHTDEIKLSQRGGVCQVPWRTLQQISIKKFVDFPWLTGHYKSTDVLEIDNPLPYHIRSDPPVITDNGDIIAAAAAVASIAVAVFQRISHNLHRSLSTWQPRFLRAANSSSISSTHVTPSKQLPSCGTSSDFIVALNYDRSAFTCTFLSLPERHREQTRFGSPYR